MRGGSTGLRSFPYPNDSLCLSIASAAGRAPQKNSAPAQATSAGASSAQSTKEGATARKLISSPRYSSEDFSRGPTPT
jgi:hypothetical protein